MLIVFTRVPNRQTIYSDHWFGYILFIWLFNAQHFWLQVKKQHLLRTVDFLVEELKVCDTRAEAEQRVFFVSAKEVLQARINEYKGLPIHSNHFKL